MESDYLLLVARSAFFILCQVLLTSDKAAANFSDRSLLKNLGHWLGMITMAKNKPILHTVSHYLYRLPWHELDELVCCYAVA